MRRFFLAAAAIGFFAVASTACEVEYGTETSRETTTETTTTTGDDDQAVETPAESPVPDASPTPEDESPTPEESPTPKADADGDGYSEGGGDCDDTSAAIHPGATEGCDAVDSDCDGDKTEGCVEPTAEPTPDEETPEPTAIPGCDITSNSDCDGDGYTQGEGDCNDDNAAINPGEPEVCGDGIDNDCDGTAYEGEPLPSDPDLTVCPNEDFDGDGYAGQEGDCDDGNASVHPGAAEVCDGKDNDCNGDIDDLADGAGNLYYRDSDGDGYGDDSEVISACSRPTGYASSDDDCDDASATVYPGATETCNNVDDDCDGYVEDDSVCNSDCADSAFWWSADFSMVTWASEGNDLISSQDDPSLPDTIESSTPWSTTGQINICAGATSSAAQVMAAVDITSNTCVTWDTANAYDDAGDGWCVPLKKSTIDHTP